MTTLYEEVISHLNACNYSTNTISDTWTHTLRVKGLFYPEAELVEMLALGCRANKWIKNLNYFLDDRAINWSDPLEMRLVVAVTAVCDVGKPFQDVNSNGFRCSSLLLHNISIAAEIIRSLDRADIKHPTLMEIGGGYGVLMAVLRSYYGERLTLIAVDLPETLCLQEWYLRTCFPEAQTSYTSDVKPSTIVRGGINFINAHVFGGQTFPIDAAVNIDSMCEMPAVAVDGYIKFVEDNIAANGLFILQNCYGHSNDAYSEMYDYPFDAYWLIRQARVLHQYQTMSHMPILRVTLQRCEAIQCTKERRTKLIAIQESGYETGLSNSTGDWKLPSSWIDRLRSATTLFQNEMIDLMRIASKPTSELLVAARDSIADTLGAEIDHAIQSDYWTGFLASALLPIGHLEALNAVSQRARLTSSDLWRVRFAYLLIKYNASDSADSILDELVENAALEWFLQLKLCELLHLSGKDYERILRRQIDAPCTKINAATVGRTLARLSEIDLLISYIPRALEVFPGVDNIVFDFMARYLENHISLPDALKQIMMATVDRTEPPLWSIAVMHRIGCATSDIRSRAIAKLPNDYYSLAGAGSLAYWAGMPEADELLDRSCHLRHDNFLHHQYVGNIRFSAGAWRAAQNNYCVVLAQKPYLKNARAKLAYCCLDEEVRKSRVFGDPKSLDMIFPTEQDYYHDIGPRYK